MNCGFWLLGAGVAMVAAGCATPDRVAHSETVAMLAPGAEPVWMVIGEPTPAEPPSPVTCFVGRPATTAPLLVRVGQPVRFVNRDRVCHRLFSSSSANAFEMPLLDPDAAAEWRFDRIGTVYVYCALHGREQLTIEVRANGAQR